MYNILYLDEVENDINQAKQWYAEQQNETLSQIVIIGIVHNKRKNALFIDR